ncbi:unnamed protein product [Symbiodinium sp. CCMP2456]|nr:unnamed protein product [Symbiodinium sp. CCMP2456]
MRAEGLSCREEEMKHLVLLVMRREHQLDDWMKQTLENRQELLKARGYSVASLKDDKKADKKGKKDKKDEPEEKKEVKEVTLKLPKPKDDARAKWITHCNRNVLKDSMVSSADLEEESIKTFAMRPALEWALLKLHDTDTSLDSMFVLLYRLYTGHTRLKLGPAGTPEEDSRRFAHTFATLVAYMQSETMEHGFLASFLNVFAHNFDELWTAEGPAADLPKPPGAETSAGRGSQSRELLNERFLVELRSWIIDRKDRLVWPKGGDDEEEDEEGGKEDGDDDDDEDEEDEEEEAEGDDEEKTGPDETSEKAKEAKEAKEGEEDEEEEEDNAETFKAKAWAPAALCFFSWLY